LREIKQKSEVENHRGRRSREADVDAPGGETKNVDAPGGETKNRKMRENFLMHKTLE
jgi:hypothetical protein